MSAISSSHRKMDKKLVQFQVVVRLGQEEAAAKAQRKPVTITVASAAGADLVALSGIIIYSALWVLFLCVLFFAGIIFRGSLLPTTFKPIENLTLENLCPQKLHVYNNVLYLSSQYTV